MGEWLYMYVCACEYVFVYACVHVHVCACIIISYHNLVMTMSAALVVIQV